MKLRRAVLLALALGSCGDKVQVSAPVAASAPAPTPSASVATTSSTKVLSVVVAPPRTRIPQVGVSVALPPTILERFDEELNGFSGFYYFRFSASEEGAIEKVETPTPKTDQEAAAFWAKDFGQRDFRVLESGGGGLEPWWAVTSFEVRVSVEGRPGMHRLQRVTHVRGALALEGEEQARCLVALEYDVEIGSRPSGLDRAIDICKSMRLLP